MTKKKDNPKDGTEPKSAKETTKRIRTNKWITVTCPTCKGTGRRGNNECGLCSGTRTIKVPPE